MINQTIFAIIQRLYIVAIHSLVVTPKALSKLLQSEQTYPLTGRLECHGGVPFRPLNRVQIIHCLPFSTTFYFNVYLCDNNIIVCTSHYNECLFIRIISTTTFKSGFIV